jgi:hypothetical protein
MKMGMMKMGMMMVGMIMGAAKKLATCKPIY